MRRALLYIALASLLGGCLDGWIPGAGKARGYKGATDDLTSIPADDLAKSLDARFKLIQTL